MNEGRKAITKHSRSLVEILDSNDVKYGELTATCYLVQYMASPDVGSFWIFEDMLEFELDNA